MNKETFDSWCKSARYSKSEIDAMNEQRHKEAVENNTFYQPYIPVNVYGFGFVVRPENESD